MSLAAPPAPYTIGGGKEIHYVTLTDAAGNPVGGAAAGGTVTARIAAEITRPAGTLTYASSALVGSLVTLANAGRVAGGAGYVTTVRLATNAVTSPAPFRVYVWSVAPTVPADNAQFALLYADASAVGKLVGLIDLALAPEGTGSDGAYDFNPFVRWPFVCAAGSQNLFATIVARGSYAAAASQRFSVGLGIEQS